MQISFSDDKEISELKNSREHKLNARNTLGLMNKDDWIFNLNIGNVMYLNCLGSDELNMPIEKTHEFSKDAMLEKVVLIASAYYCVAIEMKFLVDESTGEQCVYSKKDPETFHAKALHLVSKFLPAQSPLA